MKNSNKLKCLNLGAGKISPDRYNDYGIVVHVDQYFNESSSLDIDCVINEFGRSDRVGNTQMMCKSKLFDFVDQFPFKFDIVLAERIFEHMEYTTGEIGRLLEGINTITNDNAKLEIVVPNAILIATMLIDYENNHARYDHVTGLSAKLIINTENHNFRQDAHLSSWTPVLAKEYIESEGTWKIDKIIEQFNFAGRDIYMKIFCSKTTNKTK
jgi:hypothetical protein